MLFPSSLELFSAIILFSCLSDSAYFHTSKAGRTLTTQNAGRAIHSYEIRFAAAVISEVCLVDVMTSEDEGHWSLALVSTETETRGTAS